MPGLMVCELLPLRLTDDLLPLTLGTGRLASGSPKEAAPVTGLGLRWALPLDWTLPTTSMLPAVTLTLPLTEIAEDELESTSTAPLT